MNDDSVNDALMFTDNFPPDDDDDEPEVDEVTSSTRLIDDADRDSPTVIRRRITGVGPSSACRQTVSHRSTMPCRDPSLSLSPSINTRHDEHFCCCCCCCCNCDVSRTPPVCHCRCPATRRFYFRSTAYPSDDDDDVADNMSVCSCCQCDTDLTQPTMPVQTGNELLPVATTKLSSMPVMSLLSGRGLTDVNGRVPSPSNAKDARSSSVVVSSSTSGGSGLPTSGLATFFAFLRSGGRLWSSGRSASDIEWRRRSSDGASSTLPRCTCGLGSHFNAPLGVAQQVR